LENADATKSKKLRVRIIIPQKDEKYLPDFGCCFCGTASTPPPNGGWDTTKRLTVTINGRIDAGIVFTYNNVRYIAYGIHKDSRHPNPYMVIETLDAIDCDIAQRMSLKIISAIGFFTGDYPFGSLFVFDAETNQFIAYNGCVISAAKSKFKMISLNPYCYFTEFDIRQIHELHLEECKNNFNIRPDGEPLALSKLRVELMPVTALHFIKLLSYMESELFMRPFHLLQSLSTHLSSALVFVRLSVYATCLEMCKKWVQRDIAGEGIIPKAGSFAERECRIPSDLKKEFFIDIHHALKKVAAKTDAKTSKNLRTRLASAFTKRVENSLLLRKPFEYFKIDISSERDDRTFSLRNFITHGEKTITADFDPKDATRYIDESEEKCFGFHALIWRLIMVAIGYKGLYRDLPLLNKFNREGKGNNGHPFALVVKAKDMDRVSLQGSAGQQSVNHENRSQEKSTS